MFQFKDMTMDQLLNTIESLVVHLPENEISDDIYGAAVELRKRLSTKWEKDMY